MVGEGPPPLAHDSPVRMKTLLACAALLAASLSARAAESNTTPSDGALLQRGRYLILVAGCNDCHTASFGPSGGKTPEKEWLTGSALGFNGPWGTTYPTNLRQSITRMDVDAWTTYARTLTTRPPMPYLSLNTMSDDDLAALWTFVRSLGATGGMAPAALPPGVEPVGPVVRFPAPPPQPDTRR